MPFSVRALRLGLITLLIVLGTAFSAGWAMHQAKRQAMEDDARRASQQLGLYANALHTLIDRYRALPAVLALDPELIMYDEPFAGLDPISLGTAARLIRTLNDALGLTSILVSHDLEETFHVADHVVILGAGGIAAQGTPDEVRANPDPLVQQFIHAQPNGPVPFHYPAPSLEQDFGGQA